MINSITVPAQATQAEACTACAAALASALGKNVDSDGTKVLIKNNLGFKFVANSTTRVGIVISADSYTYTNAMQSIAYNADMVIDYCVHGDTVAVGIRTAVGAVALSGVFTQTESGDDVLALILNSSHVSVLTEGWTAIQNISVGVNVNTASYIILQKLGAVYFNSVFKELYAVTSGPNVGTNVTFSANGKNYQLLCYSASGARLAMPMD